MARFRTKTISRRTVDALKVEKDTMFWDRELPGFGVRVYPSGRKVYIVQTRAGGKAGLRVTVGPDGVISPEEARRRAALIIARIKAGEEPVPEPLSAKLAKGPTVAELARRYLEDHVAVRCRPSTAELYRVAVEKYILPRFGKQPAIAIDHAQVTELHHALRAKPVMANKVVETLSRIYNAGRGQGADSGSEQSVRIGREEPRAQAGAVHDARRVPAAGTGAGRSDDASTGFVLRRGGDSDSHPDRMPEAGDPASALGAGGRRSGRACPCRHQDGSEERIALAACNAGAKEHRAGAGQSLGDPGQDRGTANAQHRRSLGGRLRARWTDRHAHPRLPPFVRVPCARTRRESSDDWGACSGIRSYRRRSAMRTWTGSG